MRISVGVDTAKPNLWACAADDEGRVVLDRVNRAFFSGESKSDPTDARTIAVRTRTRDLRSIAPDDETMVAARLKVGRRRELVADQTRRLSRLRGIRPGLERTLNVTSKAPLALVTQFVTPAEALQARARINRALEQLLGDHPDGAPIRSLPGMGATLTAEVIACIGDIRRFPSANALVSAAGLAPVLRQSGRSAVWRGAFGGDEALNHASDQSAFCAGMAGDPL